MHPLDTLLEPWQAAAQALTTKNSCLALSFAPHRVWIHPSLERASAHHQVRMAQIQHQMAPFWEPLRRLWPTADRPDVALLCFTGEKAKVWTLSASAWRATQPDTDTQAPTSFHQHGPSAAQLLAQAEQWAQATFPQKISKPCSA